jgi:hypothetical protein
MERAFGLEIPRTLEEVCRPDRLALLVYDMQAGIVAQRPDGAEVTRRVVETVDVSGELDVLRPSDGGETPIVTHHAVQFSGEGSMISGRRALARIRVGAPGEVIELNREQLLALVQTDAELSEILMRSFILRRLELIARDLSSDDLAEVAAGTAVVSRDESSWHLCGRRCARQQYQARGVGGGRGIDCRRVCSSSASAVEPPKHWMKRSHHGVHHYRQFNKDA